MVAICRHFRGIVSLKQGTVNLVAADVTFLTRPDISRRAAPGAVELKEGTADGRPPWP
jgi:hypothetical protein